MARFFLLVAKMSLIRLTLIVSYFALLSQSARKPALSYEDQKNLFDKFQDAIAEANYKYDANLYKSISAKIEHRVSPKALFLMFMRLFPQRFSRPQAPATSVTSNTEPPICPTHSSPNNSRILPNCDFTTGSERRNIIVPVGTKTPMDEIVCAGNIHTDHRRSPSTVSSASVDSIQSQTSPASNKIVYDIPIDVYDTRIILPGHKIFRRIDGKSPYRKRQVLPKYQWSGLLREKIWQYCRVYCTITFKYNIKAGQVRFLGKCSQCTAEFKLVSDKNTQRVYSLKCEIFNYDKNFKHKKEKRIRLTPYLKNMYAKKLEENKAVIIRNQEANKKMEYGEIEPPTLPSLTSLRIIKHQGRKEQWFDSNVIISLIKMAKGPYRSVIKYFSLVPHLDLYYHTESQKNYYNEYSQRFSKITLTLDATGSMFRPIVFNTGEIIHKRLLFYTVLITANDRLISVPVTQRISDSQTSNSIYLWLREFFSDISVMPSEIITDDSSALLAAAVTVFTPYKTTSEYLKALYSVLLGHVEPASATTLNVFIRLDTSHFVKTIKDLSCWVNNNIDEDIKSFYVNCIKLIKQSDDFELVKSVVASMLVLILSEHDDFIDGVLTRCASAKLYLRQQIKNIKIEDTVTSDKEKKFDTDNFGTTDPTNDFKKIESLTWFDDLLAESKRTDILAPRLKNNKYYFPQFVITLRRLMHKLPMWSNVMVPFFKSDNKSPSSSAIENYFKILKHYLFQTKLMRFRLDEFINKHTEYIAGELKIGLSNLIATNTDEKNNKIRKKRKPQVKRIVTAKNKSRTGRTNSKKTIKNTGKINKRNVSFCDDSIFSDFPSFVENWRGEGNKHEINSPHKQHPVQAMKNGSISVNATLFNTCGFDSVVHLIAYGYSNYKEVENMIDNTITIMSHFIRQLTISSNLHSLTEIRQQILSTNMKSDTSDWINCACTIAFIYENILIKYGIFSATSYKKCLTCDFQNSRCLAFLSLDLTKIALLSVTCLEECITNEILDSTTKCQCHLCKSQAELYYEINPIISFELTGVTIDDKQELSNDVTISVNLNILPKSLIVKGKTYCILGAIEFDKPTTPTGVGHFRCHMYDKKSDQWICYDDLKTSIQSSPEWDMDISVISYVLV